MKKSPELVKEVITDLNEVDKILQGFPKANEALEAIIGRMRNTLAKLEELTERPVGIKPRRRRTK